MKKPTKKQNLKLFSVISVKGVPYTGCYGYVSILVHEGVIQATLNRGDGTFVKSMYTKEEIKKIKLDSIKDTEIRQSIRNKIEIEKETLVEKEL